MDIIGSWGVKNSLIGSCHEYFGLRHPILKKSIIIASYISSHNNLNIVCLYFRHHHIPWWVYNVGHEILTKKI